MTIGAGDDVHVRGDQVTVGGCAVHGGECALLWSTSQNPKTKTPVLALCILEGYLTIYTSSRSAAQLPAQLVEAIQSWRTDLLDNGFLLRADSAYLVTRNGEVHPLDMRTWIPVLAK